MPPRTSAWNFFSTRSTPSAKASELYGRLVAQARDPWFYGDLGVTDTPEGRLEMILMHVVLALRRLKTEGDAGEQLARSLAEHFVTDMDDCLREMGVGDITVAKKVKKAAAALFDRNRDYGAALDAGDRHGLAGMIGAHAFQAGLSPDPVAPVAALKLADYCVTLAGHLHAVPSAMVLGASFQLPSTGVIIEDLGQRPAS